MSTVPVPGRLSRFYVAVPPEGATEPTWVRVIGRVDMTLNINRGEIDASHLDSGGWATYLMGRRDWSISGTMRYLKDDPGQQIIKDHVYADEADETYLLAKFQLEEATGDDEWIGTVFASTNDISVADEAPSDLSLTLRGQGPLTKAEQPANGGGGVEGSQGGA